MVFLQSHGVGTSRAVRIYKTYGADAIDRLAEVIGLAITDLVTGQAVMQQAVANSQPVTQQAIADMAVYLAGEGGTYITGQAINVCGGVNYH